MPRVFGDRPRHGLLSARELGVAPAAPLTCDADNVASRKVITANGGVLAGEGDGVRRYRVPTGG